MQSIEIEAKSVEEARALAAQELCCDPDALDVEILEEKKGFLGVGKKVKIRAAVNGDAEQVFESPKLRKGNGDEPPALTDEDEIPSWAMNPDFDARQALEEICQTIMQETRVEESRRNGRVIFDIKGDGSGIFIGRKGSTLEALQFIINKMNLKQTGRAEHILVDSEGYIERRIDKLREKALGLADKAYATRRPQTTEPLNAHDRRVIHTTLREQENVNTRSIGEGDYKRVQISNRGR